MSEQFNGATLPWLLSAENDVFHRLPLEIVPRLTGLNARFFEMDGAYEFESFTRYIGPTAAGTSNGYTLSGTGTPAVQFTSSLDTGQIRLFSNTGAIGNSAQLEVSPFRVRVQNNRLVWLSTRFNITQASTSAVFFGLGTAGTADVFSTLPTEGYFFFKESTATEWQFHVRNSGTSTQITPLPNVTVANGYRAFGFSSNARNISVFHQNDSSTFSVNPQILSTDANIPPDGTVFSLYFAVERSVSTGDAFLDIDNYFYGSQDISD